MPTTKTASRPIFTHNRVCTKPGMPHTRPQVPVNWTRVRVCLNRLAPILIE
jgi:hypothetical protein